MITDWTVESPALLRLQGPDQECHQNVTGLHVETVVEPDFFVSTALGRILIRNNFLLGYGISKYFHRLTSILVTVQTVTNILSVFYKNCVRS